MILKHIWGYFKYIMRHKYHVFREGRKLKIGIWQLLIHDLSKLSFKEFFPYMYKFNVGLTGPGPQRSFDIAWLHHIHVNPHHWQFWCMPADQEGVKCLRMPEKYVKEMVADWRGVGLALGKGAENAKRWYEENKDTIALHPQTRSRVETILGIKQPDHYIQVVPPPRYREPGS